MNGWSAGQGTGSHSALKKKIDPEKDPKNPAVKPKKIQKAYRPTEGQIEQGMKTGAVGAGEDVYTPEQKKAGAGASLDFLGTEKKYKKKRKIVDNTQKQKKNIFTGFGKYDKKGRAKYKKMIGTETVAKSKKKAKKNIFTGKYSKKIESVDSQTKRKSQDDPAKRNTATNFEFTGTDKKGKEVDVNRKRKAVFNPKTGVVEEKIKRKSGIGYKRTGRKVNDDAYTSAATTKRRSKTNETF